MEVVRDKGNGITAAEIADRLGTTSHKVWDVLRELQKEGSIYFGKSMGRFISYPIEYKGNEMEDEQIAKRIADSVVKRLADDYDLKPKPKMMLADKQKSNVTLPPVFNKIVSYAKKGNNVQMVGPAGTGKGFLARKVAELFDAEFYEVNAVKNEYGLTGFVDANSRFVKTPFYDACKAVAEGRKAVFLFDEMDCSDGEVLKIFNEALDKKEFTFPNDEHLEFKALVFMSATNTIGTGSDEQYLGEQLDASTLNRFVPIRVDYNRQVEMSIAEGDEELVDFIDAFRRQTEKNGILVIVSYRNLKQIVSMKGELTLKEVMRDCLIRTMADDDLQNILNNMIDKNNLYYRACKGENVKWKIPEQQEFELTA
ncbi:AAA family ATPase [Treponema bryantii]|uniref:AAA family ATPase n=1 Tax=Treponema bryantii TaxID=163 RepID=UPI0015A6BDF7|nr:AAA family ATPase [Treponema bryantii]